MSSWKATGRMSWISGLIFVSRKFLCPSWWIVTFCGLLSYLLGIYLLDDLRFHVDFYVEDDAVKRMN